MTLKSLQIFGTRKCQETRKRRLDRESSNCCSTIRSSLRTPIERSEAACTVGYQAELWVKWLAGTPSK